MKTVVIKMGELAPDAAGVMVYPVQLFFDNDQENWLQQPIATSSIPQDLSVPNPPVDPGTNDPIDGNQIREQFLNEVGTSDLFVQWGRFLHQLLFDDALVQELKNLRPLYPGEGLRTILDIKPDILRWLPWELIFQDPMPRFFDSTNPFSRGTLDNNESRKNQPPTLTPTWPIHALIVVGSKKEDPAVKAEHEIARIEEAFIKSRLPIDWEICYQPTKAELRILIKTYKPEIFHFIGHGKEANNEPYLELTDRKGGPTPERWTVSDIAIDFNTWQPRFAFLNACRTTVAMPASAAQKNSWDIARTFSHAGVPAVVGMQADVQGEAAAEFSNQLYQSMLNGLLPVDRSLAEARAAVKNLKGFSLRNRDWALATLFLLELPEQILEMTPPIDTQKYQKYRSDSTLKKVNDFVGRVRQRRKIWHGVDKITGRDAEFSSAYIVVGQDQMGKTSLVQASLKVCALRNRKVCYVDLGDRTTKDFLKILQIIREGDPNSSEIVCAPLPQAPFADFDNKYGALFTQPDAVTTLAADQNRCEQFFDAYRKALIKIAEDAPFILVLDHLNVEWQTFNSVLVKYLLLPIAQDALANCRLVLVCTAKEFDDELSQPLKDASRVVDVAAWKPERYVPLARQICLYNDIDLEQDPRVQQLIEARSNFVQGDWGPIELRELIVPIKRALGGRR
jgi:CHAT domain